MPYTAEFNSSSLRRIKNVYSVSTVIRQPIVLTSSLTITRVLTKTVMSTSRYMCGPGQLNRYGEGCTAQGSNPDGGRIFPRLSRPALDSPIFVHKGYRVFFPGVKRLGLGVDHPPHLSPRLNKEQSYTSTLALGLHGLSQCEFYLYIYVLYLMRISILELIQSRTNAVSHNNVLRYTII